MAARVARFVYQEGFRTHFKWLSVYTRLKQTYPNGCVVGYPTSFIGDACCVLYRGKQIYGRNTESRRCDKPECLGSPVSVRVAHNQGDLTYLGEMPEHWHVVLETSKKRPFYTIDGNSSHMLSPFVEPCID
jgi:hypothetical protein